MLTTRTSSCARLLGNSPKLSTSLLKYVTVEKNKRRKMDDKRVTEKGGDHDAVATGGATAAAGSVSQNESETERVMVLGKN